MSSSLLWFSEVQTRKRPSHRYPRFRGASPPCIPRNRGKKGARSGGGRRMSAGAHPWWGRISTRGANQGYICRWSYFHHQSLSWLTSALRCVLYVRIGWVSPRHHFIPLMAPTIALLSAARPCEFSRLSHENRILFFSISTSVRPENWICYYIFSSLMHLCARISTWHR